MQKNKTENIVLKGIYKHYKGPLYKVHDLVRHSETLEELVLYETLYDTEYGRMWVRPKTMFLETIEINGEAVSRFAFTGEVENGATDLPAV